MLLVVKASIGNENASKETNIEVLKYFKSKIIQSTYTKCYNRIKMPKLYENNRN